MDTYTADEGRDESHASLSASDRLSEAEEEGEVAVDAIITLELAGSLDALPRRGDLDEDALLLDADRLVERDKFLRLLFRGLLVEGETCVNLGGDTARDDLQDLLAELDQLRMKS